MLFDGNLINAATGGVGVLAIFVRPLRKHSRKHARCWSSREAITDFLNGASVVPFVCLFISIFDAALLPLILENKAAMAVAGGIGTLFISGEILSAGRDDAP